MRRFKELSGNSRSMGSSRNQVSVKGLREVVKVLVWECQDWNERL